MCEGHGPPLVQLLGKMQTSEDEKHELALQLLQANANPDARDFRGQTRLLRAIAHRNGSRGAGSMCLVDLLLRAKASVNLKSDDVHEWTPLHAAASNGGADLVQRLVDNKADVHATARDGYTTPLQLAKHNNNNTNGGAHGGNADKCAILLAAGAREQAHVSKPHTTDTEW